MIAGWEAVSGEECKWTGLYSCCMWSGGRLLRCVKLKEGVMLRAVAVNFLLYSEPTNT